MGEAPQRHDPDDAAGGDACDRAVSRVLVVEDEVIALECITDFLRGRGVDVLAADTPAQALKLAADHDIALVVSDVRLPGMSGPELLLRLRRGRPDLPAILVTGGEVAPGHLPPDTLVLMKPLSLAELAGHIDRLLPHGEPTCPA
ncbi:MAG TPA: response regulator [Magnetospirillum sp.]|nr:response regulator [Magnetospirillum sp.]